MWLSNHWKDYELIDCGRGEKLERWGDQLLVRPDPQAIWNTPRTHRGWKENNGRYAGSNTGGIRVKAEIDIDSQYADEVIEVGSYIVLVTIYE